MIVSRAVYQLRVNRGNFQHEQFEIEVVCETDEQKSGEDMMSEAQRIVWLAAKKTKDNIKGEKE